MINPEDPKSWEHVDMSPKSHTGCFCRKCLDEYDASIPKVEGEYILRQTAFRFIVCPTCGNKRCPHASDHNYPCSGSNLEGQEGSVYG